MRCSIRRSKYDGWLGGTWYVLDAQLDVSDEERSIIENNNVAGLVVFDSEEKQQYDEQTQQYLENTKEQPGWFASPWEIISGTVSTFYNIGAALYSVSMSSLSTRVTIQDLLDGTHLEADNASDIAEAENIIMDCVKALKGHVEYLSTFDGREQVFEP